uniref:Taste receptor type 2 n=1 Tax=Scleropages formosus TaxID=113540 RepID=A0A8C9SA04_SCLFO
IILFLHAITNTWRVSSAIILLCKVVVMETITYLVLNWPLSVAGVLLNIFFGFCLLSPKGEAPKQPLKELLISTVFCNVALQITVIMHLLSTLYPPYETLDTVLYFFTGYSTTTSMSSCVWLSVFYHTKIVPSQRTFFTWVKRNIKTVVYCGLVVDRIFLLAEVIFSTIFDVSVNTVSNCTVTASYMVKINFAFHFFFLAYMLFFVGTMSLSWGSNLVYLCRNMKRIEMSGSPFSSGLRSQMRVTITGIIQTVLHLFCSLYLLLEWFNFIQDDLRYRNIRTVFLFFSFGTTVNFGLSQTLIRNRAAGVFNKAFQLNRK